MPPDENPELYLLPDWAVIVNVGHRLKDVDSDNGPSDTEMGLLLTILRQAWRLQLLHWQERRGPVVLDEEPDDGAPVAYDPGPEMDEFPFPAA